MTKLNNSALLKMGFQIEDLTHGVYLLKRFHGPNGSLNFFGVGLFLSPDAPPTENSTIYFYEQDATAIMSDPEAVRKLREAWANLDARQLEDSGVEGTPILFTPEVFGRVVNPLVALDRAAEGGQRPAALTDSGDVICYR